jgi:hypothetical protein
LPPFLAPENHPGLTVEFVSATPGNGFNAFPIP